MNEYELEIQAKCPVDEKIRDFYRMTLRTPRFFAVEELLKCAAQWADVAIFQENLTVEIAIKFGCECTLVGTHSGVRVRSTWTPPA